MNQTNNPVVVPGGSAIQINTSQSISTDSPAIYTREIVILSIIILISALLTFFYRKGWQNAVTNTTIGLYSILLVYGGISEWGKAGGWELAAIDILIIMGLLSVLYSLIIGIFSWHTFRKTQMAFFVALMSNGFFWFAVGVHSLIPWIKLTIGFSIPILLIYFLNFLTKKNSSVP